MGPTTGDGMTAPAIDRRGRTATFAEVLMRYATGVDSQDWSLFRSCFTDDCEADYGDIGVWHSADEITASMREIHERAATRCTASRKRWSMTDARVATRSYVDAIVMFGDDQSGKREIGYYDDELVVTDDGWKIAPASLHDGDAPERARASSRRGRPVANTAVSTRFPMHCGGPASAKVRRGVAFVYPNRAHGRARYPTTTRTRPRFWIRACARVGVALAVGGDPDARGSRCPARRRCGSP